MTPDPFVMAAQRIRAGYPVSAAFGLAQHFHDGQADKQGQPYIRHVTAVAAGVERYDSPELTQIAYLHDIVEDTEVTVNDLDEVGFSPLVTYAVEILTRRDPENYADFIERVAKNRQATLVKIADLRHNLDETRGPVPEHLASRYHRALARLLQAQLEWDRATMPHDIDT